MNVRERCREAIGSKDIDIRFETHEVDIEIFFKNYKGERDSLLGCVFLDDSYSEEDAADDIFDMDFIQIMAAGYVQENIKNWEEDKESGKEVPMLHILLKELYEDVWYIMASMKEVIEAYKALDEEG